MFASESSPLLRGAVRPAHALRVSCRRNWMLGLSVALCLGVFNLFAPNQARVAVSVMEDNEPPSSSPTPSQLANGTYLSWGPPPVKHNQSKIPPRLLTASEASGPVPTNEWWTTLLVVDSHGEHLGEAPITQSPYSLSANWSGLHISYGATRRKVSTTIIYEEFAADFSFGTKHNLTNRSVTKHDPLSVSLRFASAVEDEELVGGFSALIVRGSPYITVQYHGSLPTITLKEPAATINGLPWTDCKDKPITARRFVFQFAEPVSTPSWVMYSLSPAPLSFICSNASFFTATDSLEGVLRAAVLPRTLLYDPPSMGPPAERVSAARLLTLLDSHCHAYPVGSHVKTGFAHPTAHSGTPGEVTPPPSASITFSFEVVGAGHLLILVFPHHMRNLLDTTEVVGKAGYLTLKAEMTMIIGNQFTVTFDMPQPAFTMARPPHPAMVPEIREALLEDKEKFLSTRAIEPYWFGKEAARQARLALIADEIGENAVREEILDSLVKLLTPWMLATNEDAFIYDDLWGGITSTAGLFGMFFMKDFGNGWFSDHHFQYGYFIYTAAVIGKYRPDFLQTHRDMISSIVRDYANPSSDDAWFPLSRHFSWYDGHSWASGVFELPGGKSQESVSEAINSYYAIRLLGISANDPQLRDWGTMLMACEMQAAQMYWQMPQDSNIYEPIFRQNKMLGQVAQTSAYYGTWFGSQVEYIHLVNVIPFTPVTELFISRAYVMEEYSLLQGALDRKDPPMVPIWRQYTSLMRAIVDPVAGLTELRAVDEDTGYDDGDSKTAALHWVATRLEYKPF